MRIRTVEYYVDDQIEPIGTFSGDDIHIPRMSDVVILYHIGQRESREVRCVVFDATEMNVEVHLGRVRTL